MRLARIRGAATVPKTGSAVARAPARSEGGAGGVEGRAERVEGGAGRVEGRAGRVEGGAGGVEGRAERVEGGAGRVEGRAERIEERTERTGGRVRWARPWLLGLRPRLLAALLLTSAVTLAVAALALLSPLEQRLRSDGESTVLTALGAARPELAEIAYEPATGSLNEQDMRESAVLLRHRSQAGMAILDSQLDVIFSGDEPTQNVPDYYGEAGHALRAGGAPVHEVRDGELIVAQRLKIAGRRYVVVLTKRLDYVAPAVQVVRTAFLEAAGAGLLVALVLAVGLASTLLRRLERLRDAAGELERRGVEADPLPEDRSRDEVGELTRTFAGMQVRLARQETARRAFVATASHELRTPLASLDAMLELLEDDLRAEQLDLGDARERASRAREQSRRLSRLATDLLDLSQLDAEVALRSEPLELGELCRAVAAELELAAAERGVRLSVRHLRERCWAQADPGAIAQIVRILLDNALRVAPVDSSIELEASTVAPWAQLSVRDHGPGVPPGERERIFERFERGSTTGGLGGFGLGLAIGRELARRMDGTLELAVTPEGESGALFRLRLPHAPDPTDEVSADEVSTTPAQPTRAA
jgi:signal transduction histidine kinase